MGCPENLARNQPWPACLGNRGLNRNPRMLPIRLSVLLSGYRQFFYLKENRHPRKPDPPGVRRCCRLPSVPRRAAQPIPVSPAKNRSVSALRGARDESRHVRSEANRRVILPAAKCARPADSKATFETRRRRDAGKNFAGDRAVPFSRVCCHFLCPLPSASLRLCVSRMPPDPPSRTASDEELQMTLRAEFAILGS